jgi:CIC family chloride channel protein
MNTEPEQPAGRGNLFKLASLALLAGTASGLIGAGFRLMLRSADHFRNWFLAWAHGYRVFGCLLVIVACAFATGLAAWLVRRFSPEATGSGIPHVEAEAEGKWSGNPLRIIPVKFMGGLLSIGSGLALGREGPSIQMGASAAHLIGAVFRCSDEECRALLVAGGGAGLATAFNAPIAGVAFVMEEILRRFSLRVSITTLFASASAIAVARFFLGQAPDFHVEPMGYPGFGTIATHIGLGAFAGVLGVGYNRAVLGALAISDRLHRYPVELRAAMIGGAVGLLAWFAPAMVGGGDTITQQMLLGTSVVFAYGLHFAVRFGLGAVSYAAQTPGGLFAPMLVLGAEIGLFFGTICHHFFPIIASNPAEFTVVGLAAFFTAVVRAPLTGIILAIELTGSFTLLLPMLGACAVAMLIPTLLNNPPIYDSLRKRASSAQPNR